MAGRLAFRGCVFDADAHQLLRNGVPADLPPKAFDALRILIEARPRAISQRALLDVLWPEAIVEVGSLHNVIHALRTALGDSSKDIIRTVYGFGFAFAAEVTGEDAGAGGWRFELEIGEETIPLPKGIHVIGRDFDSLIPTKSPAISRRHARITISDTEATLEDLGSKNGTFVGGQRITSRTLLHSGDTIVFADALSAVFHALPALPETATAAPQKKEVH